MIPAAQAASTLGVPVSSLAPVTHSLGRAVCHLAQEVLLHAFQESPALPTALQAPFRTAAGVAEFPTQDKTLQAQSPLQLEREGLVKGLPLLTQL